MILLCYVVLNRFFKKNIYLFLGRGREGEGEVEKHQCVVVSRAPPTGDLAHNPAMYPDRELNQRTFGLQAGTQSTEPHQPGLNRFFTLMWLGRHQDFLLPLLLIKKKFLVVGRRGWSGGQNTGIAGTAMAK